MAWINDYKPTEYNTVFDVADGNHKVKIIKAETLTSKSGKPMLVITLAVQDSNEVPYLDRIVAGDYFDQRITRFFDATRLNRGDFNLNNWIGKEATAHFEHRVNEYQDQNGNIKSSNRAELCYYIVPEVQNAMPHQAAPQNNQWDNTPGKAEGGIW